MRIINSSQDLNLVVRFFDSDGIQINLNEIDNVTVKLFTYDENHFIEYHKSDISDTGVLRVNSADLARLANGCLYYRYLLTYVGSSNDYDITDVVDTGFYVKNEPECKRPTTHSAVSELYNDMDFVSKLWIMKHLATDGAPGNQGPQGARGTQGYEGTQGEIGTQGFTGAQGEPGEPGSIGTQGFIGTQGEVGTQGSIGTQGEIGTQGSEGPQGVAGTPGELGTQGYMGTQGEIGTQGFIGTQGERGADGNPGSDGNPGTQGEIGTQGFIGTQGERGAQGYPGPDADLSGYQLVTNLVTAIDSSSTDSQYPSAKCMYTLIGDINNRLNNI